MKAAMIYEAGGPEVLKLEQIPIPEPKHDEVLIRIKAFGLNRSELFTRQGHSPNVKFPVVLGIEACGLVESNPSGKYQNGTKVATAMGGLGRDFNGGYAEYCCVNEKRIKTMDTKPALGSCRSCAGDASDCLWIFVLKHFDCKKETECWCAEGRPQSDLRRLQSPRTMVVS